MRIRAAVTESTGAPFAVEELELDQARPDEIVVRPRAGASIAVFGVGIVGLSAVMAARVAGATTIIGITRARRGSRSPASSAPRT